MLELIIQLEEKESLSDANSLTKKGEQQTSHALQFNFCFAWDLFVTICTRPATLRSARGQRLEQQKKFEDVVLAPSSAAFQRREDRSQESTLAENTWSTVGWPIVSWCSIRLHVTLLQFIIAGFISPRVPSWEVDSQKNHLRSFQYMAYYKGAWAALYHHLKSVYFIGESLLTTGWLPMTQTSRKWGCHSLLWPKRMCSRRIYDPEVLWRRFSVFKPSGERHGAGSVRNGWAHISGRSGQICVEYTRLVGGTAVGRGPKLLEPQH